jgi:abortive infection bacteriophage resistance protein
MVERLRVLIRGTIHLEGLRKTIQNLDHGHFLNKIQQRYSFTKNLRHLVLTCSVRLATPGLDGPTDRS